MEQERNEESDSSPPENVELVRFKKPKKSHRVKKGIKWNRAKINLLVSHVKKHKILWDPKHPFYHDNKRRNMAWEHISSNAVIPKKQIMSKWKSIRSNYKRYLKFLRRNQCESNTLAFFDSISFLKPALRRSKRGTDCPPTVPKPEDNAGKPLFEIKISVVEKRTESTAEREEPLMDITVESKNECVPENI